MPQGSPVNVSHDNLVVPSAQRNHKKMNEPQVTFARLLSPVTPCEFVTDIFRHQPLHVPGNPAKVRDICSWQAFKCLLDMTALWTGNTLRMVLERQTIAPEEYCTRTLGRDEQMVLRPDPAKVQDWLARGATIVTDLVETLSPGIRCAADALEMALGSEVTCNAYCSQSGHQAFPSHFDSMEVFAMQISGTKAWRIYEGSFAHPVERPGQNYASFDQAHHDREKGAVAMEITLKPGDLLYIPKGRYHDALATDGPSLHLSFGLTEATGLDYLRWVLNSLDALPAFRASLPAYDQAAAHDAHVQDLATSLHAALQAPGLAAQFREEQRQRAHRLQPAVAMPPAATTRHYRVRNTTARMERSSGTVTVHTDTGAISRDRTQAAVLRWMFDQDQFRLCELSDRFSRLDLDDLAALVAEAQASGLIIDIT